MDRGTSSICWDIARTEERMWVALHMATFLSSHRAAVSFCIVTRDHHCNVQVSLLD